MRIGFLGKGGSGKTSLAAAFIKFLEEQNKKVLAVDADINMHLAEALGFENPTKSLSSNFSEIQNYLVGNRDDLGSAPLISTTPPNTKSNFVKIDGDDFLLKKYGKKYNNTFFLAVGKYEDEDIGHNCYHSKINIYEMMLHHLLDGKNDFLVADSTAGTDNLGTTLFFVYDLNIFVVEPTLKAISVYKHFKEISSKYKSNTFVVVNKIKSDSDIKFIKDNIPDEEIVGFVRESSNLRAFEQGDTSAMDRFVNENEDVLGEIFSLLSSSEKDWKKYLEVLKEMHIHNAQAWWNSYYGLELEKKFDDSFSYDSVLGDRK